jgi:hypothetical protein
MGKLPRGFSNASLVLVDFLIVSQRSEPEKTFRGRELLWWWIRQY